MLAVYRLKNVSLTSGSHGLPELIAIATTIALRRREKRTLPSIAGGTVRYMPLVRLVFA